MNRLYACLILCLAIFSHTTLASVLAIDYGTDFIKASLMSPGQPFDVLIDKDSKRKIQSTVGWNREDRLFGGTAFNMAGRFPTDSFSALKLLKAAPFESSTVSYYMSISTAELLKSARGTVAVRRPDGSEWNIEEITAMQFAYVRDLAEAALGGEKVSDVIVTVPPHFTQHERDAVIDALEIAGLRTLSLINDGTAVAVNYAMTRSFKETPEYHVIYDAGASSIRATVVSFTSTDPKSKSAGTQLVVHGVGYDRQVGGIELDRRLRELLISDFQKKHKKDIRSDRRGMAKLWKEAGRVKGILSANNDAVSSVESLAWDIDFRTKVTRADFESACKDLRPRFTNPLFDALDHAGLTMDNITSVILTGGASRTPMIQTALKSAVADKIAMNVNADEAAVLGAALHGAALSRQFKTKDIRITDICPYDIQVSYQAEAKSEHAKPRTINTLVFPSGSKTGTRKTLTFKRKDDFSLKLTYKQQIIPGYPTDILEAEIKGVADAIQNLTDLGATDPVVKATVVLSESGFVSVHEAVAFGDIKDDSLTGKLKGLFGASSSASENTTADSPTAARSETDTSPAASSTAALPAAEKKPANDNTVSLEVKINLSSIPPMSVAEKRTAREKLATIDRQEAAKRRLEEARNSLEGYLYRIRDLLEDNSESPFNKCSQDAERAALKDRMEETFEWLHEHGDHAKTHEYLEKRTAVESLEQPIIHRYREIEEFPVALNNSQMWNWSTRLFLTEAFENLTKAEKEETVSKYTEQELNDLEKALKEHEIWLNGVVEKQKKVKMNEDPAVESSELRAKAKVLENHLQKLVKKKVPKPKKSSTSSRTSTSSTTSTAKSSSESTASGSSSPHDEL
ncbi:Heat Shock Protein 70 (HSP70) [Abortiporus biennis]